MDAWEHWMVGSEVGRNRRYWSSKVYIHMTVPPNNSYSSYSMINLAVKEGPDVGSCTPAVTQP